MTKRCATPLSSVVLTSILASGCAGMTTSQAPDQVCEARVRFEGRTYVQADRSEDRRAVKGARLGLGRTLGCEDSGESTDPDDRGADIVVLEAVGDDPSRRLLVEDPYGLMRATSTERR